MLFKLTGLLMVGEVWLNARHVVSIRPTYHPGAVVDLPGGSVEVEESVEVASKAWRDALAAGERAAKAETGRRTILSGEGIALKLESPPSWSIGSQVWVDRGEGPCEGVVVDRGEHQAEVYLRTGAERGRVLLVSLEHLRPFDGVLKPYRSTLEGT